MTAKATIAVGATGLSQAILLGGKRICGVIMPAAWTAANLTFQGSVDGTTFFDMYDEAGAEISITAAASRYIGCDALALELSGVEYLKVRSGTTGTPVNQAAAREVLLALE
jgi:hypothetical protein